ncbi:hypothetical protein ACW95P_04265 [Candidatus Mycoplasma pogonae]
MKNKKKFLIIFSIFSVLVIPIVLIPVLVFIKKKDNLNKINVKEKELVDKKIEINEPIENDFEINEKIDKKPSILEVRFNYNYFKSLYGLVSNVSEFNEFDNKLRENVLVWNEWNNTYEENTKFLDKFLNFYKKEFNAEFFKKFDLIYLFRTIPTISGKRWLDSIDIKNNDIYFNIVNSTFVLFEMEKGHPITTVKTAFSSPLTYFVIVPKINNVRKFHMNFIETAKAYEEYRKTIPAGIIFKSEDKIIESKIFEINNKMYFSSYKFKSRNKPENPDL